MNSTTQSLHAPFHVPAETTPAHRWAGWGYVTAWLAGLVVAPPAPTASVTANAGAALAQSTLVHGVAALFLLIVIRDVARLRLGTSAVARVLMPLGVGAVVISLTQFAVVAVLYLVNGSFGTGVTAGLFRSVDLLDTAKLTLLGGFVAAVTLLTSRAQLADRWLQWLGAVLAPLLPLSGAAFVVSSAALYDALYLSLPLLLVWVVGVAYLCFRATTRLHFR